MVRHLGSTIALIIGVLFFIAGATQINNLLIAGPIIIVGALAYRSAKKRKLNEVKNSFLRKCFEGIAIALIIAAVVFQNDLKNQIVTDPVLNFIIPLWAAVGQFEFS